jgi:hypothetical protein
MVAGTELTVPWRTAREWIVALSSSGHGAILRLAENPDAVVVDLAAGRITIVPVRDATRELLGRLTGRRWFIAEKLAYTGASGEMLGEMVLSGVDPDRVGIGEWCAAVFRVLVRNADAKQRASLDFELSIPPDGEEESWDDGNQFDPAAIAAFMESQGG